MPTKSIQNKSEERGEETERHRKTQTETRTDSDSDTDTDTENERDPGREDHFTASNLLRSYFNEQAQIPSRSHLVLCQIASSLTFQGLLDSLDDLAV